MKKKLIGISISMILLFLMGACGNQSAEITDDMTPSQTVEAFLQSFKTQAWDNMDEIYEGKGEEFASAYGLGDDEDETSAALRDAFMSKLYDFDYKVEGEKISDDGKTATVDITTKAYNMVTVFNNFYQAFMDKALETYTNKSGKMEEADVEKMAISILQEQVDAAEKDYEGKAAIKLTKTGDRWVVDRIDENNPDFLNAISGGMLDVANDVVNTLEENDAGDDASDDADD